MSQHDDYKPATIELDDLIEVTLRGVERATEARRRANPDLADDDLPGIIKFPGTITMGIIFQPQDPNFPGDILSSQREK